MLAIISHMQIGVDLCDTERIEKILKKYGKKFLKRILSEEEILAFDKNDKNFLPRLASRFAAKEAIAKVLGTGIGAHLAFVDITILKNESGAPFVKLNERATQLASSQNISEIKISLSHEKQMAIAFAVGV